MSCFTVFGLLVGTFAPLQAAEQQEVSKEVSKLQSFVNAPELNGAVGWLNTDKPLSLKEFRGKFVLLDFWTFCCINCMHILPDLRKLEDKYKNELVVVGIHSAKFENEKDTGNIREAIQRYDIRHPVANDANFAIWQAYTVNSWPTLVLISPDGKIIGEASGEGNYDALDKIISHYIDIYSQLGKLKRGPVHFALETDKLAHQTLLFPGKISSDEAGHRLFVSDTGHHRILVVDAAGKKLAIIGSGKQGLADGSFETAEFHHPQGTAFDPHGNKLYIADTENHALRVADFAKRTVSTITGDGQQAGFAAGRSSEAAGRTTRLNSPWDLALVGNKIYIAMAGSHQLWVYDIATKQVASYAGNGQEGIKDGPLSDAVLAQPSGITTNGKKLFFADSEVSAVRSADLPLGSAPAVQTCIGQGLFDFGDVDGQYPKARLQHPLGVLYKDGLVYVADSYNHKIRAVDPATKTLTTLVGSGHPGKGDGKEALFSEPGGLTAIGDKLFVADTNNHAIRSIDLKTHETKTLALTGFPTPPVATPTAPPGTSTNEPAAHKEFSPNSKTLELGDVSIGADSHDDLVFDVELPKGWHLNPEAAPKFKVVSVDGKAISFAGGNANQKLAPTLPLKVPYESGPAGSTAEVKLSIQVYYCTDGAEAACTVKTLQVAAHVRAEKGAAAWHARLSVDEPK